jgi:hypothetical protein
LACPRSCTNLRTNCCLGPVGRPYDTPSPTPNALITDNVYPPPPRPYTNMEASSVRKRRKVTAQKEHTLWYVTMETRLLWSEWLNVVYINPLKHSAHFIYHQVLKNSTFCPHSVFMCFVWISEQTAIICLYSINWLVFIAETEWVCLLRGTDWIFKYTFCPHSVFMCFVWISEQTAIISLYSINWLVFITEVEGVYCAVRAGCLHTFRLIFAFRRQPFTADAHLR